MKNIDEVRKRVIARLRAAEVARQQDAEREDEIAREREAESRRACQAWMKLQEADAEVFKPGGQRE